MTARADLQQVDFLVGVGGGGLAVGSHPMAGAQALGQAHLQDLGSGAHLCHHHLVACRAPGQAGNTTLHIKATVPVVCMLSAIVHIPDNARCQKEFVFPMWTPQETNEHPGLLPSLAHGSVTMDARGRASMYAAVTELALSQTLKALQAM